jgi:transposase-like protein
LEDIANTPSIDHGRIDGADLDRLSLLVARRRVHEEENMETAAHPVSQPRTKRYYRSADERGRIVEETVVPGASVAAVARAHGTDDNQVFAWRKL